MRQLDTSRPRPPRRYLEEERRHSPHGLRAIAPVSFYGLAAAMREIQESASYNHPGPQAGGAKSDRHDSHKTRWRSAFSSIA